MDDQARRRFQVDLRGLIDLLSRHLYSSPAVFVREMLQNGVDAIQARRQIEPQHVGTIQIELIESEEGPATLLFQDDGIGLTETQIHEFLATIGQSSKRAEMVDRSGGFLGQFGIGLLSCFMVTDEIVVITKSAEEPDQSAVEWRGNANGTYTVRRLSQSFQPGTQVFLRAKGGADEFFDASRILALARDYGEYLQTKIEFTTAGTTCLVNTAAPWELDFADPGARDRLLEHGKETFGHDFLDAIPLRSSVGEVEGVAYVLSLPVHAGAHQSHRVYLKNMLLSNKAHDILPEWAFFVQCVVNARTLSPTASREAFYEDDLLEQARDALGDDLRRYLVDLARHEPNRFQKLLNVHQLAIKALALDDPECLELFADWFTFETTLGTLTLGEFRQDRQVIHYVPSRDQFRQIAQVAASESLAVINAGYVYDVEILDRIEALYSDLTVEQFDVADLSDRFEELSLEERDETLELERLSDAVLQRYKCIVDIVKFHPEELPAIYITNADADFLRSVEQTQDVADELWSDVLGGIAEGITTVYACLHLNYRNPVVRRICRLRDREAQRRCIEMLYIQALLLGHFPLGQNEIKLLNEGLLGLIDWALASQEDDADA